MTAATAGTQVVDLGPANDSMFPLMSGLQVGDVLYIGSRNLSPSVVLRYDLTTRTVTDTYELGPGKFVQALTAHGERLYAGLVGTAPEEPNVFEIQPANGNVQPLADIPGLDVRALASAPDGVIYAVGMEAEPAVWECRPQTGAVRRLAVPDPGATQARGVAATAATVYFGSGSNLAGGDGASASRTFAVDRRSGAVTSVQPHELDEDPAVRSLLVADDRLFIGTQGLHGRGHLAVLELAGGGAAQVFDLAGKSVGCFHHDGRSVYVGAEHVHRYDLDTGALSVLSDVDASERWALGHHRAELVSVSSFGGVRHVDLDTGRHTFIDLVAAGAPRRPQLGMSLAVGEEHAYVGGNGGVVRHDLSGRNPPERLFVPGEAKSMEVVGTDLYLAVYNSMGLWHADPQRPPRRVAALPVEENRPQDTAWHAGRELLLVGGQNDTQGGGSLSLFAPGSARLVVHQDPFDEHQMVRAIAVDGDLGVAGGWNRYRRGPRGEVARFDVAQAWQEDKLGWRWRVDPGLGAGVSCLAVFEGRVLGLTMAGTLFALDGDDGHLLGTRDLSTLIPDMSRMVRTGGHLYAGSTSTVMRIGADLEVEVIAADLDGQWYSGPKIAADRRGNLYTLRGRSLVRITEEPGETR